MAPGPAKTVPLGKTPCHPSLWGQALDFLVNM